MTSKLTRERIELIANFHRAMTLPPSHDEIEELARTVLATIDSEPVAWIVHARTGDQLTTDGGYVANAEGILGLHSTPLYRHAQQPVVPRVTCWSCRNQVEISAIGGCDGYCPECDAPIDLGEEPYTSEQPVPVVPDIDELRLAFEAAERESVDGFNLHKYGIGYADDETQGRWDAWLSCRAAMLQGAPVCTCPSGDGSLRWPCPVHPGNSPVIPDGWKMVPIDATRAMIDAARRVEEDGYDAMHKAMLAAAPQEVDHG
ncbi:hypothetical protein [Klebsiella michiganensis]|uniref:hypothetical protein n=1 Tax=Klebsiella michiganensis TaxID=1134687 RepID=UPI0015E8F801|nr:hypothetical protein [Klebsiella michiganensis]QMR54535.1 hypothetical protein HV264_06095 [Klebsiella michiganensis]